MPPATNTFSVTVTDAHANSSGTTSGIAAASRIDAVLTFLQEAQNNPTLFNALVQTDTWTVTVSQP